MLQYPEKKILAGANTPAYSVAASVAKKNSFVTLTLCKVFSETNNAKIRVPQLLWPVL
jgi:hypothetical protein